MLFFSAVRWFIKINNLMKEGESIASQNTKKNSQDWIKMNFPNTLFQRALNFSLI